MSATCWCLSPECAAPGLSRQRCVDDLVKRAVRAARVEAATAQREACVRAVEELIERRWPDAGDRPSSPPAAVLDALTRVAATPLVSDAAEAS